MTNKSAYKYKTQFKGSYKIVQIFMNGTVTLQMGVATNRMNIRRIKPCQGEESELHSQFYSESL